jgi:hypothetical protein
MCPSLRRGSRLLGFSCGALHGCSCVVSELRRSSDASSRIVVALWPSLILSNCPPVADWNECIGGLAPASLVSEYRTAG